MSSLLEQQLEAELQSLASQDRLRACPPLQGHQRKVVTLGAQDLLNFCSNDYLGLANHPAVVAAAVACLEQTGLGAGASRLVSGDLAEHRAFETALATFLDVPAVLLFPTGYQTNIGVVTSLAGPEDLIVSDSANHASLIDGCRLSRATVRIYPHLDAAQAAEALTRNGGPFRRRFLLTESLFSMDGDIAPLAALAEIALASQAHLIVDEAHAIGVLGPGGRGLCAATGIRPAVLIGTLGKAFGSFGGYAAGSASLRAILVNRARTFLFTTAAPPAVAAASQAALAVIAGPEGDARRVTLQQHLTRFTEALPHTKRLGGAILPYVLGSDRAALAASARLREAGLFVAAIRPPTVPEGTARLRITLSAAHLGTDVDRLTTALRQIPA